MALAINILLCFPLLHLRIMLAEDPTTTSAVVSNGTVDPTVATTIQSLAANVSQSANISSDATTAGSASISSDATTAGSASISSDATTAGSASISSDATTAGSASISSDASTAGSANISIDSATPGFANVSNEAVTAGFANISADTATSGFANISNIAVRIGSGNISAVSNTPVPNNGSKTKKIAKKSSAVGKKKFELRSAKKAQFLRLSEKKHVSGKQKKTGQKHVVRSAKMSQFYPKKSALRYGFQYTSECKDFEKAFLCVRKCLDHGFDVSHSNKSCVCTCFKSRDKGQYTKPRKHNTTKWKLGTPTTGKPYWAQPKTEEPSNDEAFPLDEDTNVTQHTENTTDEHAAEHAAEHAEGETDTPGIELKHKQEGQPEGPQAAETPEGEHHAEETPAGETHAEGAPAGEGAPHGEETPGGEAPAEAAPGGEAPAEAAPAEAAPAEAAPEGETPAEEAPAADPPAEAAPAEAAPAEAAPAADPPAEAAPAE